MSMFNGPGPDGEEQIIFAKGHASPEKQVTYLMSCLQVKNNRLVDLQQEFKTYIQQAQDREEVLRRDLENLARSYSDLVQNKVNLKLHPESVPQYYTLAPKPAGWFKRLVTRLKTHRSQKRKSGH